MRTALDNGQRSPRKLLAAAVVRRVVLSFQRPQPAAALPQAFRLLSACHVEVRAASKTSTLLKLLPSTWKP